MDSTIIAALITSAASIGAVVIPSWLRAKRAKKTNSGNGPPHTGDPKKVGPPPPITPPRLPLSVPPPAIILEGKVIKTMGNDLGMRVEDGKAINNFWRTYQVDTQLDWFDKGNPVVSIGRARDIAQCKIGDHVRMTLEVQDRSNGKRGTRVVAFTNLSNQDSP